MSYIDQSTRPSPAGMAAVIGVHAAIGAILSVGRTRGIYPLNGRVIPFPIPHPLPHVATHVEEGECC